MKKIIFGMLFGFLFALGFASADYSGYFPYMTQAAGDPFDYTFNVSIDENANQIIFNGIENPLDAITVPYDSAQVFTKRINYVWFHGWFDNSNMYVNQYVGTGTSYLGNAIQIMPGVYQGEVILPTVPFYGFPLNMPFTVRVNTNSGIVTAWLTGFPTISFSAPIDPAFGVAGRSFGPFLMQAGVINQDGQMMIEVQEWIKEDIASNGLSPRWIVALNPVLQLELLNNFITEIREVKEIGGGNSGNGNYIATEPEKVTSIEAETFEVEVSDVAHEVEILAVE